MLEATPLILEPVEARKVRLAWIEGETTPINVGSHTPNTRASGGKEGKAGMGLEGETTPINIGGHTHQSRASDGGKECKTGMGNHTHYTS